jgi:hypothetical protein
MTLDRDEVYLDIARGRMTPVQRRLAAREPRRRHAPAR